MITNITKRIENKTKEQRCEFLFMILGVLGASLLGSLFPRKEVMRTGHGVVRTVDGMKKVKVF